MFRRLRAANPEPRGELERRDPFTLLVAVVLSAQSTDKGVNQATRELFEVAQTPEAIVALGEERLRGLHPNGQLPPDQGAPPRRPVEASSWRSTAALCRRRARCSRALPGVGRKSASVVLNIAFGEPTIAVDTHIFRVANRIPLVVAKTTDETQAALERVVPDEFKRHAHHWLILHGRYVCKARRPEC